MVHGLVAPQCGPEARWNCMGWEEEAAHLLQPGKRRVEGERKELREK